MARRHIYTGMYSRSHHRNHGRQNSDRPLVTTYIRQFIKLATDYLWFVYNKITNSYTRVTLATVFIVVLLSFLIPDISQKIHAKNDLKSMKKIINLMSQEVSRAEVACHAVADDICYLHCSMHDHAAYTNKDLRDLSMCTNCCMHSALPEPIQIEKKIGFFRRIFFPQRNTSHKITVNNIGNAYDLLHKELKGLVEITEIKQSGVSRNKDPYANNKGKHNRITNQNSDHDLQIQTKVKSKNDEKFEESMAFSTLTQNLSHDRKKNPSKNASTLTRYPSKSTAVGLDTTKLIKLEKCSDCRYKENNILSHKDYECCDHDCNKWKF